MSEQKPAEPRKSRWRRAASVSSAVLGLHYYNPRNWFKTITYKNEDGDTRVLRKPGMLLSQAMEETRKSIDPSKVRKETFEQSVKRQGLSDTFLRERHKEFVFSSRICYGIGSLIFAFAMYYAAGGTKESALNAIVAIAFGLVAVQCALARAFRAWQIECKTLHTYTKFLTTPEAWIP